MKKIIFFTTLLMLSASTFSQQSTPFQILTKQDYLQKSKNQRTLAWSLLGGGVACYLIGRYVIPEGQSDLPPYSPPGTIVLYNKPYKNGGIKFAMVLTGFLSSLISIPIFFSSSRNKREGMHLSFINELSHQIQGSGIVSQPIPSLALKLSL